MQDAFLSLSQRQDCRQIMLSDRKYPEATFWSREFVVSDQAHDIRYINVAWGKRLVSGCVFAAPIRDCL